MTDIEKKETRAVEVSKSGAVLFTSVNKELVEKYVAFWSQAWDGFLELYKEVEMDGTEDGLRCRMIAAHRLAQLSMASMQFWTTCSVALAKGKADVQALNAVAQVVGNMVSKNLEEWMKDANGNLS